MCVADAAYAVICGNEVTMEYEPYPEVPNEEFWSKRALTWYENNGY